MAIILKTILENGTSGEYYRVEEPNHNYIQKTSRVVMQLYANKEYADKAKENPDIAGRYILLTKYFDWNKNDFPFNDIKIETPILDENGNDTGIKTSNENLIDDTPRAICYKKIKQTDEFKNAVDDL